MSKKNSLWIARDKNGTLRVFVEKPTRVEDLEMFISKGEYSTIFTKTFQSVTWENSPKELTAK